MGAKLEKWEVYIAIGVPLADSLAAEMVKGGIYAGLGNVNASLTITVFSDTR